MKKIVLFFLTSIASIWFIDALLSGFQFQGGALTVFLVDLFIIVGIYLAEWVASKAGKSGMLLFFILATILTFFSLYFATLALEDFNVGVGTLNRLNLGIVKTPIIKGIDQILTLLLGSLIASIVGSLTKWGIGK